MALAPEQFAQAEILAMSEVRALFLHGPTPTRPGDSAPTPMIAVQAVEALTGRGLKGDSRFLRATRRDGSENLRQVSLIDAGTLEQHTQRFGPLPWELVKSQIVLGGALRLPDLLDHYLVFGEGEIAAILQLTISRQPCYAMDLIAPGLRAAMEDGAQGALARVVRGGTLHVGQTVTVF